MADTILKELTAACPAARAAGTDDAVAGVAPRYVAAPASVAEASALLRAAAAHNLAVVPRGSGSRLAWGAPPARCDLVVETLGMAEVLEHAAGDLVVRAQAGVTLERLAGVLAGAGQQFPVDAPGGGTVGGVLATAVAGPRRLRYGTPRDLVIGITVVRADGTVARSGGKVVKNVAGYDLGKLFAGSYGTLGLIAEAVFRLYPLPAASRFVTLECADPGAAATAVAAAAASAAAPAAVEIDRPGPGGPIQVGVLLEGEPDALTARAALLRDALGGGAVTTDTAPAWWGRSAMVPGELPDSGAADNGTAGGGRTAGGTLIRVGFWAAALAGVLAAIGRAAAGPAGGGQVSGPAGALPAVGGPAASGVLYARFPAGAEPAAVASFLSRLRAELDAGAARSAAISADAAPGPLASAVVLHAAPEVRDAVDMWGPVPSAALMRAVKDQFDPGHLMAPGRFAGGI